MSKRLESELGIRFRYYVRARQESGCRHRPWGGQLVRVWPASEMTRDEVIGEGAAVWGNEADAVRAGKEHWRARGYDV